MRLFRVDGTKSMGCALLALCAAVAEPAHALPRYAAAYGQECGLCHHDPTGGGLRSTYASQFLVPTELAWRGSRPQALEGIEPAIGEHLVVGADLRVLVDEPESEGSTLLTMQTDLHVVLQMDERTSVSMDLGSGRRSEAYGMWRGLPWQGWTKVGRFVPAYGWRFADHSVFVRQHLLSTDGDPSPVGWEDTSVEAGVAPGPAQVVVSVQAGGGDVGESWTTRAVVRDQIGPVSLAVGAGLLRREGVGGHRGAHGVFGAWGVGRFTYLAQADVARSIDRRREWILTQQLAFTPVRGWALLLAHDYHDPDRDRETGARQRYGVGLDVLLTPFVGFTGWLRLDDSHRGPVVDDPADLRLDVVAHFLF